MFPSSNMDTYKSEIQRLFSRPNENDLYNTQYLSPLSGANRSSSSAESTSPDSVPELFFSPERNVRLSGDIVETPRSQAPFVDPNFTGRRQRPIVGRKILPPTETPPTYEKPFLSEANIWHTEEFQSSQPMNNYYIENKYTHNVYYELFPSDNRGFEFPQFLTPVKQTTPSPSFASPALSSPMKTSPNYHVSPNYSYVAQQPRYGSPAPNPGSLQSTSAQVARYQTPDLRQKMCTFCRKNGETPVVYMTHSVKERAGNKYVVTCPILRSHVCSTCGGTGDEAHTITYCPVLRSTNNGQPLQSTTITLKNTRVKSNGRRRY